MSNSVAQIQFDLNLNTESLSGAISTAAQNISTQFNSALSTVSSSCQNSLNEIAENIERAAQQSTQAIQEDFSNSADNIADDFKDSTEEIRSSTTKLENNADRSSENIKDSFNDTSDSVSKKFKQALNKMQTDTSKISSSISNKLKMSLADIKAGFDMAIGSVRSLISGCKSLMSAYQTQIESESKLAATMRNSTNATDKQIESVKALASELQGLGVVGDEVQLAGAQELATYVSNTDSIKTMLPVLDDMIAQQYGYSASTDSAVTIATMLGKVLQGQTSALSRYGYSFTEAQEKILKYGTEEQRVATLAEVVNESVNGVNSALANTPTGKVKQLSNDFGDLKETLGNLITNVFYPLAQWLDTIVQKLNAAFSALNAYIKEVFGINIENVTGSGLSGISDSADDATDSVDGTTDSVKALKKSLAGFDQLNILSSEDGSSDDTSDSVNTSTTLKLDTSSAQSGTESLIDSIQKKLQSFFKNSGFDDFVSEIQKGISDVDFVSIKENFQSVMQSLQPIAQAKLQGTQKIFKSTMKTLGKVIGGTAKVAGKSIQTISGGVAKWLEEDKGKIVEYIDTISTNISSGIDSVGNFVDTMTDTVGASIDRMRPQMENAIAKMLSGITTFSGNMGVIFSEAFSTATGVIDTWATDNEGIIGEFTDNIQLMFAETMTFIGNTFSDAGDIMLSWWTGGGQELWEKFIGFVTDLGTVFMDVFNNGIRPAWDTFIGVLQSAWDNCIAPVFERVMAVVTQVGNMLMTLWNNILKPVIDWMIDFLAPWWQIIFNNIQAVCDTVFAMIGDAVNGFLEQLGGLMEFLEGVFSGDWEKMWNGLQEIAQGIWDAIWGTIKGVINLIIDGINTVWSGIYFFAKGIVDTIGGIAGAIGDVFGQDWHFSMPDEPPLIPKLAKGGLVTAPTLALVGDNKNAASDPEVVAPLSKLKGMIADTQQTTVCDERIIRLLQRIYDLLNSEETQYVNNIYLDSDVIERKLVKVRKRKSRRYGGAT